MFTCPEMSFGCHVKGLAVWQIRNSRCKILFLTSFEDSALLFLHPVVLVRSTILWIVVSLFYNVSLLVLVISLCLNMSERSLYCV